MAPAPGRFGLGFLLPLGDQAPCVPHHHGPLEAGALEEMDAGTEGELDLLRGEQETRGCKGPIAGDRRSRRFVLQQEAALLLVVRAVRKTHRARLPARWRLSPRDARLSAFPRWRFRGAGRRR